MKHEIDHPDKIAAWIAAPGPAVFQGQDLASVSAAMAKLPLGGCSFLGCVMGPELLAAAARAECFIVPRLPGLPFDPFIPALYTPGQLFDRFDPERPESHKECLDWRVYASMIDPATRKELPAPVDVLLMRRLHDASIAEALGDVLDAATRLRTVAIMGGHDAPRNAPIFKAIAYLALELSAHGFLVLTGGGPGVMEAANLGAYAAGFRDPKARIDRAIAQLSDAPLYSHADWLTTAYRAWKGMGAPDDPDKSRTIGIPTWFYGHEPPNLFATHIAKYFENSVREEGLLAVAVAGAIFAEGGGGTVQEIFQDACQNYYRTYDERMSPMVLLGTEYWHPSTSLLHSGFERRKPAYPLLEKLATERGFNHMLLLTDDLSLVTAFLKRHAVVLGTP